jgi:CBS domain-containing protein
MQAKDLMSRNLVVVPPETPVAAVAELLAERHISAVPVVDREGRPQGIVTAGDLIRRLAGEPSGALDWFLNLFRDPGPLAQRFAKAHGATARDVMSKDLVTVGEEATAEEIAALMEKRGIRRVLVVKDGTMSGLVSRADLLRAVLRRQTPPSAATATGAPVGGGTADDAEVLRRVVAAMREQPWADTFWVYPDVAGGVVSFHGFARSDAVGEALRVLAQEVPGVTGVQDRMEPMPLVVRAMA